jgi:hypothetical protein
MFRSSRFLHSQTLCRPNTWTENGPSVGLAVHFAFMVQYGPGP